MISEQLAKVKASIPEGVTLVAVSKYHPVEALKEAYDAGQRIFGESRENELKMKEEALPKDIVWHFIGHLQTNKVKYIAPFVSLIHSVDTERLLDEIEKQAVRFGQERQQRLGEETIDVLLQLHVAQEESKSGFAPDELIELLASTDIAKRWPHVKLRGVMGMASFVDDQEQWRREFRQITECHRRLLEGPLKQQGITAEQFSILSFGMSEDYPVAIEEGATMVRVGSKIFGARVY